MSLCLCIHFGWPIFSPPTLALGVQLNGFTFRWPSMRTSRPVRAEA